MLNQTEVNNFPDDDQGGDSLLVNNEHYNIHNDHLSPVSHMNWNKRLIIRLMVRALMIPNRIMIRISNFWMVVILITGLLWTIYLISLSLTKEVIINNNDCPAGYESIDQIFGAYNIPIDGCFFPDKYFTIRCYLGLSISSQLKYEGSGTLLKQGFELSRTRAFTNGEYTWCDYYYTSDSSVFLYVKYTNISFQEKLSEYYYLFNLDNVVRLSWIINTKCPDTVTTELDDLLDQLEQMILPIKRCYGSKINNYTYVITQLLLLLPLVYSVYTLCYRNCLWQGFERNDLIRHNLNQQLDV